MSFLLKEKYTWKAIARKDADPIPDSRVIVYDKGNSITTDQRTNAQGEIPEQVLECAHHTSTGEESKTPHIIKVLKYGYNFFKLSKTINKDGIDVFFLEINNWIVETTKATAKGYAGIDVDHSARKITITQNISISKLYDYMQAEGEDTPQFDYLNIIRTMDGKSYVCRYNVTINNAQLAGTGLKLIITDNRDCVLTNGGTTNAVITDRTGTFTSITLGNVQLGSEVRLYRTDSGDEFKGIESATASNVIFNYNHTEDINVWLVVHHIAYEYLRIEGIVLTADPQVLPINQRKDRTYKS
jgi:hypothetical protein